MHEQYIKSNQPGMRSVAYLHSALEQFVVFTTPT